MIYKFFLFTLTFILTKSSFAQQNTYTYEDLTALESQGAYKEFFDHYKDIRPSLREEGWKALVKRMGEEYAQKLANSVAISSLELKEINKLNSIGILKSDEIFDLRRKNVLSRYFSKCFINSFEDCYLELQKSIDLKNDGKEILFELGEILRKNYNLQNIQENTSQIVHIDLWPYYEKALKDEMAEFYCKEDIQKGLIWNKLIEETQKTPITGTFKMTTLLHNSCWKKERLIVQNKFLNSGGYTQDEAYRILILANDMTELEKAQNALIYILNSTKTGELLNMAWKEVAQLKDNYALREKVIKKMKLLDPLPGVIFNSFKDKRISLVIKYVFENVPEYIDLYTQTCLKYMASEETYLNGNPTPYCQELFELAKAEKMIPTPLIERFAKLRNFNFDEIQSE